MNIIRIMNILDINGTLNSMTSEERWLATYINSLSYQKIHSQSVEILYDDEDYIFIIYNGSSISISNTLISNISIMFNCDTDESLELIESFLEKIIPNVRILR